jgi:hypothetical protein
VESGSNSAAISAEGDVIVAGRRQIVASLVT